MDLTDLSTSMSEESTSRPHTPMSAYGNEKATSYFVDWEMASFGIMHRDGSYEPRSDFSIRLDMLVEAEENTGYLCTVKRAIDKKESQCFVTSDATNCKVKFIRQMNNSFGSGGMSSSFNDINFSSFIQFLKQPLQGQGAVVKKAACRVGQQYCGNVWVLGPNLSINEDGEIIDDPPYLWIGSIISSESTVFTAQDLVPKISTPLSTTILKEVIGLLRTILKHNFFSTVLVVAGGIMALHYITITQMCKGCPTIIAVGQPETGKTTALTCAVAITGSEKFERATNAFYLERASLSSLPYCIDDPPKSSGSSNISDLVVDIFSGDKTASMKKIRSPVSAPLIASNFSLQKEERVQSRAIEICFDSPTVAPDNDIEQNSFDRLDEIINESELSTAIGWAISLRNQFVSGMSVIKGIRGQLRKESLFKGRRATNWSILLFFVKQLADKIQEPELYEEVLRNLLHSTPSQPREEDVVTQTVNDVIAVARTHAITKVRQYMRCDTVFEGQQVLVIVLTDQHITGHLSHSISDITSAVTHGYGRKNIPRDFLVERSMTAIIKRGDNSRKRKCAVIYLSKLDPDVVNDVKEVCQVGGLKNSTPDHGASGNDHAAVCSRTSHNKCDNSVNVVEDNHSRKFVSVGVQENNQAPDVPEDNHVPDSINSVGLLEGNHGPESAKSVDVPEGNHGPGCLNSKRSVSVPESINAMDVPEVNNSPESVVVVPGGTESGNAMDVPEVKNSPESVVVVPGGTESGNAMDVPEVNNSPESVVVVPEGTESGNAMDVPEVNNSPESVVGVPEGTESGNAMDVPEVNNSPESVVVVPGGTESVNAMELVNAMDVPKHGCNDPESVDTDGVHDPVDNPKKRPQPCDPTIRKGKRVRQKVDYFCK